MSHDPTIEKLTADLLSANMKVSEFRETNVQLLKEAERLRPFAEQFAGLDAEKVRADLATLGQQTACITELEGKLTAATAAAAGTTLRSLVGDEFARVGGRPEALDFVVSKAREVFDVTDGQVVARVFSPDRPGERLSVGEFIAAQTKASSFAFFPSSGGGATQNHGQPGSGGVREVVDPTPAQLGQLSAAIKLGTVRVRYSQ